MREMKIPAAGILALLSVALMMLPIPRWAIDLLFTMNIATGLVVLLAAMKTEKPLDFSIFPAGLLLATLLRLSLNVASTRLILTSGHAGGDAAGKVIEAFGKYLLGGNFIVGIMVFAILLIINFVVITKGAGRIAEVSARFALDSMPGKQMAIDADLSAGLINEQEAKSRREEVSREADFYGSMDGASKFVRGDAMAAILIFFIGAIGGIIVGMVTKGLGISEAANAYLPLAVGDAIASQIPSLLLSVAAALIVSKSGSRGDLSANILAQFAQAGPLRQASVALAALGLLPSMPHVPFLFFAGGLWFLGGSRLRKDARDAAVGLDAILAAKEPKAALGAQKELSWDELSAEDAVALEIGYRLIPLADPAQGGDFLAKARALRRKFADAHGFLPPPLRVRDNLELDPGQARLLIRGTVVAEGAFHPDKLLCLREGEGGGRWPVPGIETRDPAFNLPALWIDPQYESGARANGFVVIQPSAALATLFSKSLADNAKALFGLAELKALLEWKFKDMKNLADWVPGQISYAILLKVCKELLEEGVSLRDFESLLAELCIMAKKGDSVEAMVEASRLMLSVAISMEAFGQRGGRAYILDERLEKLVSQAMAQAGALEPQLAKHFFASVKARANEEEARGERMVLLVSEGIRAAVSRLLRRSVGDLRVLSFAEIPDGWNIDVVSTIN
jgi:flagellar biosynthesis protein FlhA